MSDRLTSAEPAVKTEVEIVAEECLHSFNELGITLLPSSRKVRVPGTFNETALSAAMTLLKSLPLERIAVEVPWMPSVLERREEPISPIDVAHEIHSIRDMLGAFVLMDDTELNIERDLSIGDALAVARSKSLLRYEGHHKVLADHYVKKSPAATILRDRIEALPPIAPSK